MWGEHNINLPEHIYQELLKAKEGRTLLDKLTNCYMATKANNINEYLDFMPVA